MHSIWYPTSSARAEDFGLTADSHVWQPLCVASTGTKAHRLANQIKSHSLTACGPQRLSKQDNQNSWGNGMNLSQGICESEKLRGFFQRGSAVQVSALQRYGRTVLISRRLPYPRDRSLTNPSWPETDSRAPPASGDRSREPRGRAGNHDHDQDIANGKAA